MSAKTTNIVFLTGSPAEPASHWQPYRRSCDQLGVCQRKTPPCAACQDEVDTCTVWEHMGYWLTVGVVSVATVGVLAGVAGFVVARWL